MCIEHSLAVLATTSHDDDDDDDDDDYYYYYSFIKTDTFSTNCPSSLRENIVE